MSVCNIVAYQFEVLVARVANEVPDIIAELMPIEHEELVEQDYLELKDTIVNFKPPF
jgi:hypothetical protein